MRVLLITARYPPAICGVGDHSAGLRDALQRRGHTVLIATGTAEAAGQDGVHVYPFDAHDRARWLATLVEQWGIQKVLWQYSPYALHPKGMPWWVVQAAKAQKAAGVRQYAFFHEVRIRYAVPGLFNKWRAWQQQQIASRLVKLCDAVATSIPFYLQYLEPPVQDARPVQLIPVPSNIPVTGGEDMRTVQAGVVAQDRAHAAGALSTGFGMADSVGVFANRALPGVVEALARVQRSRPSLNVVWLGHASEPERTALQEQMVQHGLYARCTGALPLPLLAQEMEQVTLLLLPQPLGPRGEGGISLKNGTLAAAFGAGLSVIATRGDMTGPELQHGTHLHLLDDNSADAWQEAIARLLSEPGYAQSLAEGGRRFYHQHLTWNVAGRQFEAWIGCHDIGNTKSP